MTEYFYMDGSDRMGPFSLEELQSKGIEADTFVWFEGQEDWKEAGQIGALSSFFQNQPPPLKKSPPAYNQAPRQEVSATRDESKSTSGRDLLLFVALAYWFFTNVVSMIQQQFVDNWYEAPWVYVQIGMNLLFGFIPIVIAISVKNQALKIVAIIMAILIVLHLIYQNFDWLINVI